MTILYGYRTNAILIIETYMTNVILTIDQYVTYSANIKLVY